MASPPLSLLPEARRRSPASPEPCRTSSTASKLRSSSSIETSSTNHQTTVNHLQPLTSKPPDPLLNCLDLPSCSVFNLHPTIRSPEISSPTPQIPSSASSTSKPLQILPKPLQIPSPTSEIPQNSLANCTISTNPSATFPYKYPLTFACAGEANHPIYCRHFSSFPKNSNPNPNLGFEPSSP